MPRPTRYTEPAITILAPAEYDAASAMASSTEAVSWALEPVFWAAAASSVAPVARGEWMGARKILSKSGKRIWAISSTGLSRRQAKISDEGWGD